MEWLRITSNSAMSRSTFDMCFLQVFLGHTSYLTRWRGTAAGLGAAAAAHTALQGVARPASGAPESQRGPSRVGDPRTWSDCLEQDLVCCERGWAALCTHLSFCLLLPLAILGCLSVFRFQLHHSFLGNPYFDIGLLQVVLYPVLRYCNLPTCNFDLRS